MVQQFWFQAVAEYHFIAISAQKPLRPEHSKAYKIIVSPTKSQISLCNLIRLGLYYLLMPIWAASWQNQQSDCAPTEDSDQPGYPGS